MHSQRTTHARLLPLIVAALVVGCQAPRANGPTMTVAPTTSQAQVAAATGSQRMALVHVDLRQLGNTLQAQHKAYQLKNANGPTLPAFVKLRITATGKDFSSAATSTVDFNFSGNPLTAGYHTLDVTDPGVGSATLSVPVGINRSFLFEGLDSLGNAVFRIRSMGSVSSTGTNTVVIDGVHDAGGRVLQDLIDGPQAGDSPDTNGISSKLTQVDLTADILTLVTSITAFSGTGSDTHYGNFSPLFFPDRALANKLWSSGTSVLSNTSSPDSSLTTPTLVNLKFHLKAAGSDEPNGTVKVNTSAGILDTSSVSGADYNVNNVPPGKWIVSFSNSAGLVGTQQVDTSTASGTIDLALTNTFTQTDVSIAAPANPPAPDGFPTVGTLPFVDTLAGSNKLNDFGIAANAVMSTYKSSGSGDYYPGGFPSKVAYDNAGLVYVQAFDQIMLVGTNGFTRLAWSRASQADGNVPVPSAGISTFTVGGNGTVYLVDASGALRKITTDTSGALPLSVVTRLGSSTQANVQDMAILGNLLYLAKSDGIVLINAVSGNPTTLVDGNWTSIATGDSNTLFAWGTPSNGTQGLYRFDVSSPLSPPLTPQSQNLTPRNGFPGSTVGGLTTDGAPASPLVLLTDPDSHQLDQYTNTLANLLGGRIGTDNGGASALSFNQPNKLAYSPQSTSQQPILAMTNKGDGDVRKLTIDTSQPANSNATTLLRLADPKLRPGVRNNARFMDLHGIAFANGKVYTADQSGNSGALLEATDPGDGTMSLAAGNGALASTNKTPSSLLETPIGRNPMQLAAGTDGSVHILMDKLNGDHGIASFLNGSISFEDLGLGTISAIAVDTANTLCYATDNDGAYIQPLGRSGISPERHVVCFAAVGSPSSASTQHYIYASTDGGLYDLTSDGESTNDVTIPTSNVLSDQSIVAMCTDQTNVYVATASAIAKVNIATKECTLIAGNPNSSGLASGTGTNAAFTNITGLAIDTASHILYASEGQRIRRIRLQTQE